MSAPGELKIRALKSLVGKREIIRQSALFLIESVEPLSGHCRHKEQSECPR